jgi:YVTN family beta-propeller protein
VIDTATDTVTATVDVGNVPWGIAVNPTGTKVYVVNSYIDNSVSIIDTATNTVEETVPVGNNPIGVVVNPAGTEVYVTNNGDKTVSVIDTRSNTVTSTVDVGERPFGIAINPKGTRVYVANAGPYFTSEDGTVSVIDTETNTVTATVSVGNSPYGIAVTPDGSYVYVANTNDDTVSVIDTYTNDVISTLNVGRYPDAFGQFIGSIPSPKPVLPIASFSAYPLFGVKPHQVSFKDKSTGLPTSWCWDFGDGNTSIEKNPVHTYYKAGRYSPSLTVGNDIGSDTRTRYNYIVVM